MDKFKSNVPRLVNISKIVDQRENIAVVRHVLERENLIIVAYFVYANKTINDCCDDLMTFVLFSSNLDVCQDEHRDSRETKQMFPEGASIKCMILLLVL